MAMKSYYLEDLDDDVAARAALTEMLPRQSKPWVLFNAAGDDAIACFNVDGGSEFDLTTGPFVISADISGRHYHEDAVVLDLLRRLRQKLGGTIRNDDGRVVT
ncbi:hypothetical protein GAO09_15925 [Rhizobiales bacterium RZME27]|uniref:Uncharacterized protein n=3 Tax=Endobacterium cereale TaxID=2663029 RepID=A0A6A8A8G3_9HYPH|nr:hypothetical protein [Endobacterium cereale]MQY47523.1 hypothetical protein [Endobacterium cereale]